MYVSQEKTFHSTRHFHFFRIAKFQILFCTPHTTPKNNSFHARRGQSHFLHITDKIRKHFQPKETRKIQKRKNENGSTSLFFRSNKMYRFGKYVRVRIAFDIFFCSAFTHTSTNSQGRLLMLRKMKNEVSSSPDMRFKAH